MKIITHFRLAYYISNYEYLYFRKLKCSKTDSLSGALSDDTVVEETIEDLQKRVEVLEKSNPTRLTVMALFLGVLFLITVVLFLKILPILQLL